MWAVTEPICEKLKRRNLKINGSHVTTCAVVWSVLLHIVISRGLQRPTAPNYEIFHVHHINTPKNKHILSKLVILTSNRRSDNEMWHMYSYVCDTDLSLGPSEYTIPTPFQYYSIYSVLCTYSKHTLVMAGLVLLKCNYHWVKGFSQICYFS